MRISDWKPLVKNTLRGFFTLELDSGLIIHDCSLHEKNSARWIGLPSHKFTTHDGRVSYKPFLEFVDRQIADRFRDQVLKALDEIKRSQH